MRLADRFKAAWRAFAVGAAEVTATDQTWGHDDSPYQAPEYGDYILTSDAVHSVLTLRADLLSSLPLRLYRGQGQDKQLVEQGLLFNLLRLVNPFWTWARLITMTEFDLGLWGEAFWVLERGVSGKLPPREIWRVRPDRMYVFPHPTNYIDHYEYVSVNGAEPMRFETGEVIWMPLPNPLDEFSGMATLAAARLAADVRSAAWKANRNLFAQGMQMGGVVMPENQETVWTPGQAEELEKKLDVRFRGVDKAHKWGVFRQRVAFESAGMTPDDAQFVETLNLTMEDVARVYRVPLDLVGGQRTYENLSAAERFMWEFGIVPRARFLADELQERLLPLFNDADSVWFDTSQVAALQEAETERWGREQGQIEAGAITINEWRQSRGLDSVAWGDAPQWYVGPLIPQAVTESAEAERRMLPKPSQTRIALGSAEHERRWRQAMARRAPLEKRFETAVGELFARQRQSVLDRLREGTRTVEGAAVNPFDQEAWIKRFRVEMRPYFEELLRTMGTQALEDLAAEFNLTIDLAFDVTQPEVFRFLEQRAQRFAQEVNQTTWDALKKSLGEALAAGETLPDFEKRVEDVMGDRIRSSARTIAQTEVGGAANGGTLLAWGQAENQGVRLVKGWLAAFVNTRESHAAAHQRYSQNPIPITDNFVVGAGAGPAPGQIGRAEEDINCQCVMYAQVVEG